MKKYKSLIIIVLISLVCFGLDLLTKRIAISNLVEGNRKELIDNFFYLTLCYNTGGAWSIFSGNVVFLIIISLFALGIIIYTMIKSKSNFYKYSSAMFIGGLVGNLVDRIFFRKVTDFLDFIIFGYDFPVFNVADTFICVGVVLMLIAVIKEEKHDGTVSA